MINYMSIRDFVNDNPTAKRFKVFRVFDGYMFTVKQVKADTVILNTDVNLEISQDDENYKVHESTFGLDYTLPKIFRYAPDALYKPVQSLNFRKELNTRLHSKKHWAFGRIIKECFYPFAEDLRTPVMDDMILCITFDYEFNELTKEVVYRNEVISWLNELGEVVHQKNQPKIYVGHEGMKEAQTRRTNIINDLKHDLDSLSKGSGSTEVQIATQELIAAIDPYINLYILYGSFALVSFVQSHQNILLDNQVAPGVTVRMLMISKLDFLTVEAQNPDLYKGSKLEE